MPSKSPQTSNKVLARLVELGEGIRQRRKFLKLSAVVVAESAGISRVTLHRIEKGEPSVTLGAYFTVMEVLGLKMVSDTEKVSYHSPPELDVKQWLPLKISLSDYPQLRQLSWHITGTEVLTPKEALGIYELNWRHINIKNLEQKESDLLRALRVVFNGLPSDV